MIPESILAEFETVDLSYLFLSITNVTNNINKYWYIYIFRFHSFENENRWVNFRILNTSETEEVRFIGPHFLFDKVQFHMDWNTGSAVRNEPEIIVWICGKIFVSFQTRSRILNDNNEYNNHFCVFTARIVLSQIQLYRSGGFFLRRSNLRKDRNNSKTTYFKHIIQTNSVSFWLGFSNTGCSIRKHVCLCPNTFLRLPVHFRKIFECSPNGLHSSCVQTISETLMLKLNRLP